MLLPVMLFVASIPVTVSISMTVSVLGAVPSKEALDHLRHRLGRSFLDEAFFNDHESCCL